MGKGRRRRSFSDSSDMESESESESSSEGDEEGRQSNSASDQEADNWVLCDRCAKWRRIPAAFVDQIREDTPWYCEHNPNKAFASCSVPQELTNEEIDAEGDSDGAGESDQDEESLKRRRIPAVWQLLKDNILAHRKRKVQDEDDIMICHCKPTWRGGDGCGPDCINRMLCIECVPGFCPSEDKCTNQMFSKRMYANLEIRRAGAKGFGLFALEDIKAGQFIIEYIGEVLEEDEYQRRKEYYMSVGQRHYYFMNIGNGEVIDACRKGNISRFINHSCEPNCETQKWLVRGELAIGLFAVRDIPKDTELTFDYNFERYGDKPMRCYCGSTNCRKFIGGMQDNFDVSLLPAVEPDDARHDLPPIMLTDNDMDPNMRMLLEWRVGTLVDKSKEMGMITRLERLCKARNVTWTVRHYYGQEPIPMVQSQPQQQQQSQQQRPPLESLAHAQPSSSGQGSGSDMREWLPAADVTAAMMAKAKEHDKADKTAAGAAIKGKGSGSSVGKHSAEAGAGLSKLRLDDGAGNVTPAVGAAAGGQGGRQPAATTPSTTPEVAHVRGPKALFKQWKIMQQQDTAPAPATEEKPAATPSSPPSPRSQHSPPSPQSPPSPRSSLSLDNDDAALDEVRNTATDAAKHVPLRKRLRRLPPKPPAADGAAEKVQNGGTAATSQGAGTAAASGARRGDGSGTGSSGASVTPAPPVSSSGGVVRKNSLGSGGAAPASAAAGLSYSPPRSTSPPPPSGMGRGGSSAANANRKLRSEIDRRLDEVVGSNGRLKDPSRQNIIKVLRLFNLCDIGGGHGSRGNNGFGSAAGGRYLNGGGGGLSRNGDDLGLPGPGPGSAGGLTARQRARMADLSLLLDVILKTTSSAARKELVTCGLLTQLHQAMARHTGKEYCVILRKVLRVVEVLPLEANDVYAVRTAHGNFADMLRQLSSNADYDVRTKAAALLKKFPQSAVTDQRLLQLMAAPPMRFGHGRGGGGGIRNAPFSTVGGGVGGGMGMLSIQQQQLLQQHLLKQQHMMMMRLKDAGAGSSGLPPPPPLLPGTAAGTAASGDATGAADATAAGSLPRTSSTASLEEDNMEVDPAALAGQNGPTGLPPLGPGRQRALAVAAVTSATLASRPGLFRPMMGRSGAAGMAGPMVNGGMGSMGAMGAAGFGRGGGMGAMGMGPSPLGLPPRPPSPASMDLYSSQHGGGAAGEDPPPHNASKRRKFNHVQGLDSTAAGDAGASPFAGNIVLPGPPPRPPYSLVSSGHQSHHNAFALNRRGASSHAGGDGADGGDVRERGHAAVPPPPPSSDLPGPPPRWSHVHFPGWSGRRAASEERRDLEGELQEHLSAEQLFALQRPLRRPPSLPSLHGRTQPEPTDIVTLFALGLYGSYGGRDVAAATAGKAADESGMREDESCCWSPILSPSGPPMSPILEPPPLPSSLAAVGTASTLELPLPPPPPHPQSAAGVFAGAAAATLWEGTQLRPLRTQPTAAGGGASGPSPYHQHSSPYGGWDAVPGGTGAGHGPASTTSTPTVSGFGSVPAQGGGVGPGGFQPSSSAPGSATAAAAAAATAAAGGGSSPVLPPVVPISSLSDWRLPPPPPPPMGSAAAGGGAAPDATAAAAGPRASPHPSPGPHVGAGAQAAGAGRGAPTSHGSAGGGHGGEVENIDEWLRPVSVHHADVWEEPDASFEAYVADMVRHRLGKYLQPEHPSRVSVHEAQMLRAKVYREVVAKERRAWEERRSAGVFKPIERHKLEMNLKEFVRSTIKRMRDREKEKAAAVAGGTAPPGISPLGHSGAGGPGRPHGSVHPVQNNPQHHHHHHNHPSQQPRQSLSSAYGESTPLAGSRTPPLTDGAGGQQATGAAGLRAPPSPAPVASMAAAGGQSDAAAESGGARGTGAGRDAAGEGRLAVSSERPQQQQQQLTAANDVVSGDPTRAEAEVTPNLEDACGGGGGSGGGGTGTADVAMAEAATA